MNSKNVKVIDEHNIDRNANIMFAFDLEGSEYAVYWIERDGENNNIFVSKVIKNIDNTFNMINIEDSSEKLSISDIVKSLISKAVSDQSDKISGDSTVLADGKNVKFIAVSFNREQSINVQKTYITTVKKEVTHVTEKYYAVDFKVNTVNFIDDIFPTITPVVKEEAPEVKEVVQEVSLPNIEQSDKFAPDTSSVIQEVSAPVLSMPTVEVPVQETVGSSVEEFVAFGTEPTPIVEPQPVQPVLQNVVPEAVSLPSQSPMVETPQTVSVVSTPEVNMSAPVLETATPVEASPAVVTPTVVEVAAPAAPAQVVEPVTPVVPSVSAPVADVSQPLMFNASKETNLNAALGEAASTATIPVENIEPVREFGVDAPVQQSANVLPLPTQAEQNDDNNTSSDAGAVLSDINKKAGFADSKFFMVVAVAFFLASCVFLGYEVFNYFQLTK